MILINDLVNKFNNTFELSGVYSDRINSKLDEVHLLKIKKSKDDLTDFEEVE
jgi:hypothetical protein